jgi:hypothetical protein
MENGMRTFDIYPKKGKRFSLEFDRFVHSLDRFILYDSGHEPSHEAFLLFDAVAAIVPQEQPHADDVEAYRIYLRNNEDEQYVKIHANVFDLTQPPSVKFYTRVVDNSERHEVTNVYVAISEVVAIIPDEGLRSDRKRSLRGYASD